MPAIVYWPGTIKPGVSNALWSQVDLYASIASLIGYEVKDGEAVDSENILPVLLGKSQKGREIMLEEAYTYGLRIGNWKYIEPTEESHAWIKENKNIEGGLSTEPQLYNLSADIGEQYNLAEEELEKVQEMQQTLKEIMNEKK